MAGIFSNRIFLIGFLLFVIGSGPLLLILLVAELGLTSDPNPNPVFLGMMTMVTFWPGLILMALGVITHRRMNKEGEKKEM